jgi:WD40 repeat protein
MVRLWDALTGKCLCALPRVHSKGVSQVAFSADGKWLASVGQDDNHTVATYYSPSGFWHDGSRVAVVNGPTSKILFAAFAGKEAFPLMIGGV